MRWSEPTALELHGGHVAERRGPGFWVVDLFEEHADAAAGEGLGPSGVPHGGGTLFGGRPVAGPVIYDQPIEVVTSTIIFDGRRLK